MMRIRTRFAVATLASFAAAAQAGDTFVGCSDTLVYKMVGQNAVALPPMCTQINALAADGRFLFVADDFGVLYSVDTLNGMTVQIVAFLPSPAQSIAAGGGKLFAGSADGNIRGIDPQNGQMLSTWSVNSNLHGLALSDQTLIAGGTNTFIYKGNTSSGGFNMIAACGGQVTALATDGTLVFAGTPTGVVYRYTVTGAYQGTFQIPGASITGMAVDGQELVVVDAAGKLRRVNPATGAVLGTIALPAPATSVAVTNGCRPDMNDDGQLNVSDFGAFMNRFSGGDMRADMNQDAALNVADFGGFLNAFASGCD